MQVIAREMSVFVNKSWHLLIKDCILSDFFINPMPIRVYSSLAELENLNPFRRDFASIFRFPGN